MAAEERRILDSVCDSIRSETKLSRDQWEKLHSTFGERFERAWKLVEEHRVKRYIFEPSGRVVWIAVGRDGEYQMLPEAGYCSCDDFYFRIVDGDKGVCYHLIAQKLAQCLKAYEEVREGDEFFNTLTEEWRTLSLENGGRL